MSSLLQLFAWRRWWPEPMALSPAQKIKAGLAALLAIGVSAAVTHWTVGNAPWLAASMGAASVILFVLPASPLAQPWSFVGGHLVSAAIGVACAKLIGVPVLACACAVGFSIMAMTFLRCLHPPAGSIALMGVIGGPAIKALGFAFVVSPVLFNSLLMLGMALILNNLWLRHPYPRPLPVANPHQVADAPPLARLGVQADDLDAALAHYGELLDVGRDDLAGVLALAQRYAAARAHHGLTCADIMSRDLVTVAPDSSLQEAWRKLRRHRVRALPVVDAEHRVLGVLALVDFLKRLDGRPEGLRSRLMKRFGQRGRASEVGAVMTSPVVCVAATQPIVDVVPLLSDHGLHHLPVLDDAGRLVGLVTQSDLIAALYSGVAAA
ncbi:HPP family protein [Crenobacter sp. SG2303]|uniref:HPP family protein n=2 Tax=Crenobacter oryzisoli TaxID=3056844 RepID=A0ABT7XKV1_9NEIS|nr:HPP family protein [Crenobacter sp. SG2303]MDN0074421.1 HPP family protein [Crenobacter sp. SG2303]